jgi:hypothetical protein
VTLAGPAGVILGLPARGDVGNLPRRPRVGDRVRLTAAWLAAERAAAAAAAARGRAPPPPPPLGRGTVVDVLGPGGDACAVEWDAGCPANGAAGGARREYPAGRGGGNALELAAWSPDPWEDGCVARADAAAAAGRRPAAWPEERTDAEALAASAEHARRVRAAAWAARGDPAELLRADGPVLYGSVDPIGVDLGPGAAPAGAGAGALDSDSGAAGAGPAGGGMGDLDETPSEYGEEDPDAAGGAPPPP